MRDPVALDQQLEENAARMDFFQVLRLIENAHPQQPRIGASLRPRDDAVRFGQDPSLVFHPAMLDRYQRSTGEARARLAVNFFGLLGANGPLPIHLTEYVRDRLRNGGDATLRAFLDVFHHRLLSLFYRARASAEPTISLDRADAGQGVNGDRFSVFVGSLFGIGAPALRERDDLGDFAKLHFAGLLANRTRPAAGLASILRAYFGLPLQIEQFVGHWMRLPSEVHSRIGRLEQGNRLGGSLVLGKQVWDSQNKFRIVIGPMPYHDYCRLLPGGDSQRRLLAWVKNYAGLALDWDVRLILQKAERPALQLGGATRLGWSTWLASRPAQRDPDQLVNKPCVAHNPQVPA